MNLLDAGLISLRTGESSSILFEETASPTGAADGTGFHAYLTAEYETEDSEDVVDSPDGAENISWPVSSFIPAQLLDNHLPAHFVQATAQQNQEEDSDASIELSQEAFIDADDGIEQSKIEEIATYLQEESAHSETVNDTADHTDTETAEVSDDTKSQMAEPDLRIVPPLNEGHRDFSTHSVGRFSTQQIVDNIKLHLNALQNEQLTSRKLTVDLQSPGESLIRMTIQPDGAGQHRVAFFIAQVQLREEIRRNLSRIRDAAANFPITISDISINDISSPMNRTPWALAASRRRGYKRDE